MAGLDFWLIFGFAALVAACATPLMRRIGLRTGTVDQPAPRKIHLEPVPLLGGVAIYAAVLGAMIFYRERREFLQLGGILLGATWVSFWGVWDDRNGLRASLKLGIQTVAALVLIASGIQVQLPVPGWVNIAVTLLWIVGITNAFNLIDNLDGLCAGVGAVAAGTFVVFAALNGQYLVGALAAALLGACLGFLAYNFNPARIFMGDAGSLFIGFLMAALGIKLRFPANVPWVTWMIPVLVLAVPIFDTALVTVSRLRRGLNPLTAPGKDHVSHRLLRLGWTHRETAFLLYLAGCASGGVALLVSTARIASAYLVAAAAAVLAVWAIIWLERRLPGN